MAERFGVVSGLVHSTKDFSSGARKAINVSRLAGGSPLDNPANDNDENFNSVADEIKRGFEITGPYSESALIKEPEGSQVSRLDLSQHGERPTNQPSAVVIQRPPPMQLNGAGGRTTSPPKALYNMRGYHHMRPMPVKEFEDADQRRQPFLGGMPHMEVGAREDVGVPHVGGGILTYIGSNVPSMS